MKKPHELRDYSIEDLENLEREQAEELMQMRIKVKMHQADNPLAIRTARRQLALIKTVINEKRRSTQ
jgi:large subunit ribosomal protein L29